MYCILIAGMPAIGKTRFATWLSGQRGLPFVSKDSIKEQLFDTVGFDSREGILWLIKKYDYEPVTVLFDGQIDEIYRRFVERDQSSGRHRGHVVNTCFPEIGDPPSYVPMSPEQFAMGMEYRGLRRFDIGGRRIHVDTKDFAQVDYAQINEEITAALEEKLNKTIVKYGG